MRQRRFLAQLAFSSMLLSLTSCDSPRTEPRAGHKARKAVLSERSFRLANGLDVDLLTGPCGESAVLLALFEVGADHDPPGRSGMTHLVERLLSTAAGGAARIVESGADHTLYSVEVASEQLLDEIDALAARMARVEITEADLARERAAVLEELARRRGGDASLTATSYAAEAVQPSRGEGWRRGIAAEVEAIELAEIDAFWQANFAAGNARIVIVGGVDPEGVRSRVQAAFAELSPGTPPVARDPADATVTGTLVWGDAPSAAAMAVPAPAPSEPVYPAFLVLAARLTGTSSQPRAWEARYDPLTQPETLFVTGAVAPGEHPPEAAADRIRAETATLIAQPLTPGDVAAARERFVLLLGLRALEPALCANDPRAFALARARRAQLGLGEVPLASSLDATTQEQLDDAAAFFAPRRTAAVIAGGTIR